jgi:hypothetical protein
MVNKWSVNVEKSYAKNWGAWEAFRESYANSLDADPDGMIIRRIHDDHVEIYTRTTPELAHILILGAGTKGEAEDTIGQFGEGFKLAAKAAVAHGGTYEVEVPGYRFDFVFEEVLGHEVLHMQQWKSDKITAGCLIRIKMRGVGSISGDRFLTEDRLTTRPLDKPVTMTPMEVYMKGMWVQTYPRYSLWNWNLGQGRLNRDRHMVNQWDLDQYISDFICRNIDEDLAHDLVSHEDSYESQALCQKAWKITPDAREAIKQAFFQVHGPQACLSSDEGRDNSFAQLKGCNVVRCAKNFHTLLESCGVPSARMHRPKSGNRKQIAIAPRWRDTVNKLYRVLQFIGVPGEVRVFVVAEHAEHKDIANYTVTTDNDGGIRYWIHRDELDNNDLETIIGCVIHAAAHVDSRVARSDLLTELTLRGICGRFAMNYLGEDKERSEEKEE